MPQKILASGKRVRERERERKEKLCKPRGEIMGKALLHNLFCNFLHAWWAVRIHVELAPFWLLKKCPNLPKREG